MHLCDCQYAYSSKTYKDIPNVCVASIGAPFIDSNYGVLKYSSVLVEQECVCILEGGRKTFNNSKMLMNVHQCNSPPGDCTTCDLIPEISLHF